MDWKPLFDEARWGRGDLEHRKQLLEESISSVAAVAESAQRLRAYKEISEYLARQEAWTEASEVYSRVVALSRNQKLPSDEMARCAARYEELELNCGRLDSARVLFEEALDLWRSSQETALHHAASWYEELAAIAKLRQDNAVVEATFARANSLRIEANGSYFQVRLMRHDDGQLAFHDVYFSIYGRVRGFTGPRSPRMGSTAELKTWATEQQLLSWLEFADEPALHCTRAIEDDV